MKKVRRPRTIRIGKVDYKLVSKSKTWRDENKAFGMCHYEKPLIEFDRTQSPEELIDTILHEVSHAIICEYNIKINRKAEEVLVTRLANGLSDLCINNPEFVAWLQRKTKQLPPKE